MRARRGVAVMAVGLGALGMGLGVQAAPAVAAPPAPNGLTPILVQLKAVERQALTAWTSTIARYIAEIQASGSLGTQDLNNELNGISQGLQQIEQQYPDNPHNGLVSTIVNELNDYVNAHGGTIGGGGGGGA